MTNQLMTSTSREPPPAPRELLDYLASRRNSVEVIGGTFSIPRQRIPTGSALTALTDRRELLARTSAAGASLEQIVQRVSRVFMRFPQGKPAPDQTQATLFAYAQDLSKFPLWAIDKGIVAILAETRAFMPSSLELRHAVELAFAPIRQELADLEVVLTAEPIDEPAPEDRAKVAALMKDLRDELKQNADPLDNKRRPPTRAEAQSFLDRCDPTAPMPKFSPELRKILIERGSLPPTDQPQPEDHA